MKKRKDENKRDGFCSSNLIGGIAPKNVNEAFERLLFLENPMETWDLNDYSCETERLNNQSTRNGKVTQNLVEASSKKNTNCVDYEVYKGLLGRYKFRVHHNDVYLYVSKLGYFKKLLDTELKVLIRSDWPENIEKQLTKYKVDDVIDRLRGCKSLQIDSFDKHINVINFKNKVLCIQSDRIYDHSPKFNFKSYINANYIPDIKREKGRVFRAFINQCTEGDKNKTKLIQEICGYVISNYSSAKKFFVFIGKPHTGKSTLLDILKEIVGSKYTSAIPLHKLGDRFMSAELFEAKLNISGELNEGQLKGLSTIKALTGNDAIIAERKGKDPFVFKNKAKLIFAGNQMPVLKRLDSTSAFFDRIIFVTFNNTIPEDERDLNLKEKMLEERDYIVYWALKGLRRLIENNFIFTSCNDSNEFKRQYVQEMNTAISFIESCCDVDWNNKSFRVHKRDLYNAYCKYCASNCLTSLNKTEFFNQIKSFSFEKKKFRYKGSIPLEGFIGISLKEVY
ncbi:DNA primase family protein [Aneurinibacillus aneurinilyticus]|uniref:DNA primase family protein n=1 Tax=Aneurinibacillus aneurinilyticus TaxID=1391 RepID=UPI0023F9A1E3|nr:phage/plasmid primase, P4 family [Aneurinibacillus aneurinilyticus]MCI1693395.1 phage/plasmid primase, P4 family [Aneurinibacillus aneurinilyticus]